VGRILVGGVEWNGQPVEVPADWLVVQGAGAAVAIRPLQCRVLDEPDCDRNPQRRLAGKIVTLRPRLEKSDRGVLLSLPLIEASTGVITQHLLFSGWCVVLLDRPEDVNRLAVCESFADDGQVPRTYGELIRTVELCTPDVILKLERDMLTGAETRCINGTSVP